MPKVNIPPEMALAMKDFSNLHSTKKRLFVAALAEKGTVRAAARIANISTRRVYDWLKQEGPEADELRKAVELAKELSTQKLEEEVIQRAGDGWDKPVFQKGQQVGTIKDKSDILAIFMLKARRPEVYRENVHYSGQVTQNQNINQSITKDVTIKIQAPERAVEVIKSLEESGALGLLLPPPAPDERSSAVGTNGSAEHRP